MKADGMMCGMCGSRINAALRRVLPEKVTSSHSKGETVILTETDIPEQQLCAAIAPTGCRVLAARKEIQEKKGMFGFRE